MSTPMRMNSQQQAERTGCNTMAPIWYESDALEKHDWWTRIHLPPVPEMDCGDNQINRCRTFSCCYLKLNRSLSSSHPTVHMPPLPSLNNIVTVEHVYGLMPFCFPAQPYLLPGDSWLHGSKGLSLPAGLHAIGKSERRVEESGLCSVSVTRAAADRPPPQHPAFPAPGLSPPQFLPLFFTRDFSEVDRWPSSLRHSNFSASPISLSEPYR